MKILKALSLPFETWSLQKSTTQQDYINTNQLDGQPKHPKWKPESIKKTYCQNNYKYQAMENEYLKYYMKKKDKLYNSDKNQV